MIVHLRIDRKIKPVFLPVLVIIVVSRGEGPECGDQLATHHRGILLLSFQVYSLMVILILRHEDIGE